MPSGVGDGNAGDLAMRGSERRSICTSKLRSSIGTGENVGVGPFTSGDEGLGFSALDMYSAIGFGDHGFANHLHAKASTDRHHSRLCLVAWYSSGRISRMLIFAKLALCGRVSENPVDL